MSLRNIPELQNPGTAPTHGGSFDHLVGAGKQDWRDFDAERPRSDQIDDQLTFVGCATGRSAGFAPRRGLSRPGGPVAPAHGCATPSYQILKRGSPVLEIASAIQAFALALSAIRSARKGALSLRPPALMY